MHPNPIFRTAEAAQNLAFAAEQGFGMVALNGPGGLPHLAHVPFLIEGDRVLFHLVRSNPIVRALKSGTMLRCVVRGPHGYISPDWYGVPDQVPTWNYVAVQIDGRGQILDQDLLPALLDRLSERFETALAPKPVWKMSKMDPDALARMMRMIVPVQMQISAVTGTWKLSQNKDDAVRLAAADGVVAAALDPQAAALAALMRDLAVGV
ncbi:FMN-binding negative transcriptional regulator [Thalassobius sp. Cn5-15]|uniref:FMN-binding negative transcriptional regulator n=1 Tax=Thalassobius sp. Cn5-15 TaxID=2917763 RepID=UPI001EF1FEE1|nr:FMN-binding negative transcriptional regulator [Thalassobius sp. Cn5-15]MCG7494954.1 FMN-binding negative transcriptional regulator [Thalassobius sp. Cn5-15]